MSLTLRVLGITSEVIAGVEVRLIPIIGEKQSPNEPKEEFESDDESLFKAGKSLPSVRQLSSSIIVVAVVLPFGVDGKLLE